MSKKITIAALLAAVLGVSACAGSSAGPAPEPDPIVEEVPTQKLPT